MKKAALILLAVAALGGGGYYLMKSRENARVTYRESKVRRDTIALTILATGTVQPENRLEIKAPIAGRIDKVLVKEGMKVKKGQVLAIMSSTERAALLDAASAKGPEETKRWETLYRPTPVMAPINGTIILRNVESGQSFTATDAILVMSDRLTVKAQVDETDIAQIKLAQEAEIVLDAYSSEKVPAKVDQIAFEAKTVNNVTTYLVDVLPNKTPEQMRSGMTANVTFVVEKKDDVLVVSSEALKPRDGKTVATVRGPDGAPTEREVETGISDGKRSEIKSGLNEGDTVLVAQASAKQKASAGTNPFSPMRPSGQRSGKGGAR